MPEWGTGTVAKAERVTVQEKACQRLQIRFDRGGLKTVATAIAPIVSADDPDTTLQPRAMEGDGSKVALPAWLENATEDDVRARFGRLPEKITDRRVPVAERFQACLGLFRWTTEPRSLVDWAAVQTGLPEPLAVFTRGQLENYFEKYRLNRDSALRQIVEIGKRECHPEMVKILAAVDRQTQLAVQRALKATSK
ncbi:MAG: hypothetical protein H6815_08990 [Phycisphaeraceae bacterium]|nr:hypothetical protein [Phycisphaerales bacterium]MCB9860576.1 hypothetical protein [Phycisphaeraceae bacterium]